MSSTRKLKFRGSERRWFSNLGYVDPGQIIEATEEKAMRLLSSPKQWEETNESATPLEEAPAITQAAEQASEEEAE